jgi:hypothetical protein
MSIPVGTGAYLMFGLTMMNQMEANMDEWKDRIRKEWENSKNYPRKKKKRVRKELLLDWSIANWNPFDDYKL